MEKTKVQQNTDKLIRFICDKFEAGELDNNSLLEVFKVTGHYLNLETISNYAKRTGMTYQGVKYSRQIETIYGVKFVIDND